LYLQIAEEMINASVEKAEELGISVVISVVDSGGHLVVLKRMDGAIFGSIDISKDKAFTSAATKTTTEELGKMSQSGQSLFGLNTTNQCRYVIFGGGIPLFQDNILAGSIGVSGGTVEQDVAIAQAGIDKYNRMIIKSR